MEPHRSVAIRTAVRGEDPDILRDLSQAFLRGCGQELGDADHAMLQGCAVLTALWCLIKARESGQPSFEDGSRAALRRLLA